MVRKPMSEENKALARARLAVARQAKVDKAAAPIVSEPQPEVAPEQSYDDLKRMVNEMQKSQELMMMALRGQNNSSQPAQQLSGGGRLLGEVEKYSVDPARYPDPTPRLAKEPRLAPLAFSYNYELDYQVAISSYETKTGANFKEPKFLITLNKVAIDDEGNQTNKRYIARQMVFHEDPQAAIVIARENGISLEDWKDMDNTDDNQRAFLNEMRYLRVREWLFGIFWPKPAQNGSKIREEVIGGQIVQVFTKNSENSSSIDFDKIDSKLRS